MKTKNPILWYVGLLIFLAIFCLLTSCLQSVSAIEPMPATPASADKRSSPADEIVIPTPGTVTMTSGAVLRTVCATTLYVRSGPSKTNAPLDVLTTGKIVSVREWSNGWARIGAGQWVNGDYLCEVKK